MIIAFKTIYLYHSLQIDIVREGMLHAETGAIRSRVSRKKSYAIVLGKGIYVLFFRNGTEFAVLLSRQAKGKTNGTAKKRAKAFYT